MSPPLTRINSDERLPAQADVVVIGGGVIGVSAAYHLAKKGLSVALVEKGHVGGEQSSRNWGWCRQQGRARAEIPLAREALRLWEDMQNDAGVDAGFRRTGVLFLTKNPDELPAWERWAAIARETAGSLDGAVAGRGRRAHARQCRCMGRRPAHAERRARRAVDGRAGARDRRAQARRHHSSGLRRARAGDAGRTGERRRHREGHHSHAVGAAGGRRLVVAVLPPPRHRAADRPRQRHRMPHHAGAGDHDRARSAPTSIASAAASMAALRWRCATAARSNCRRICSATRGPSGRPTSIAGRG